MRRLTLRVSVLVFAFALVGFHALPVAAQDQELTTSTLLARSPLLRVFWSGPVSISPNEAIQSNESSTGLKNAVDLVTSETFNNMKMADGSRSMTFGRTLSFIPVNATAPPEFPKALFEQ
jgi:hypothetical protein